MLNIKLPQISALFALIAFMTTMVPTSVFAEAICDVFTVTPDTALPGDFVTLDWVTTNTISVDIDVLGTVATSGSVLYEVPNAPGPFYINLTAFDENVSEPNDAFCSVELTIQGPAVCDYFFAGPDTLDGPGDVTLEWGTTGADISVSIDNGIGAVASADLLVVPVSNSTTFTLTADGTFGSAQCSVPVTVNSDVAEGESGGSNSGGGKSINPKCELSVDKTEVKAGDSVMVSWKSTNTETLELSEMKGGQSNLLLSTSSQNLIANGSFPVAVSADTVFKMVVKRPNRSSDCSVAVVVKPNNINGAIAGETGERIPLATLPVTGLDPTVGFLILFNLFLAFGAAMGAYVVVMFSQQYRRATDRSFTNTHVFTPLNALFSQERRSLHSRIILWKWLAVVLIIAFVIVLWSML